ncbi:cupin domain-containing protein [Pseudazoarcus pumilus]|uniref:Cupin domain-containing protein n=1 Tax=Pseudazoarcus pumilus TaxID=2067960 RepID=A0A2I6S9Q7_9RHOO|nr:cupin domain-containing protein [Pseudazoarcus pumilus]AUN95992.1 cupin domain-containing protein [Pseudazoarcus pumilus]
MDAQIAHDEGDEYFFREGCHITEWWNRSEDGAASIARVRVEAGVATRWHRLAGVTERYVILSGRGRVEVGDSDRLCEEIGPGDVVLIPPDTLQRITAGTDGELLFLAVCTPRFTPACYEEPDRPSTA